jgi:endonuclease YncB( thermonuclease family)
MRPKAPGIWTEIETIRLATGFPKTGHLDCETKESYGRLTGKVKVQGEDICLDQLGAGIAWHYKPHQSEQSLADWKASPAGDLARQAHPGLWHDPHAISQIRLSCAKAQHSAQMNQRLSLPKFLTETRCISSA